MTTAMAFNALSRRNLEMLFDRVAFCHEDLEAVPFATGFNTQRVALDERNLIPALKASGAIPLHALRGLHQRCAERTLLGRRHHRLSLHSGCEHPTPDWCCIRTFAAS